MHLIFFGLFSSILTQLPSVYGFNDSYGIIPKNIDYELLQTILNTTDTDKEQKDFINNDSYHKYLIYKSQTVNIPNNTYIFLDAIFNPFFNNLESYNEYRSNRKDIEELSPNDQKEYKDIINKLYNLFYNIIDTGIDDISYTTTDKISSFKPDNFTIMKDMINNTNNIVTEFLSKSDNILSETNTRVTDFEDNIAKKKRKVDIINISTEIPNYIDTNEINDISNNISNDISNDTSNFINDTMVNVKKIINNDIYDDIDQDKENKNVLFMINMIKDVLLNNNESSSAIKLFVKQFMDSYDENVFYKCNFVEIKHCKIIDGIIYTFISVAAICVFGLLIYLVHNLYKCMSIYNNFKEAKKVFLDLDSKI